MSDLDRLFNEVKLTGDLSHIYGPLANATHQIAGKLDLPAQDHDDVLHDVLSTVITRLDKIQHVGALLAAIKYTALRHRKRNRRYDQL